MEQQPLVSLDTQLGPWAEYLNAYTTLIKERGYSPASVQTQVQLITKVCGWLQKGHTEVHALDEIVMERFLRRHQSAGAARRGDAAALFRFLHMLREQGATQRQKKPPLSPQGQLTTTFGRYLLEERGLTQATVVNYVPFIDQFLSARFQRIPLNLSQLRAPDVTDFVRRQAHKLSPGRAQLLVTALRSFLRYLRHQGKVTTDLAVCVPTVARWSFATLPKFLPADTVQKVLDRNHQQTPVGRRNYAILLLLARLGLRACEIVALDLEDIDWENARITIRSKGGRWAQLPLPVDVGEALALYLRHGRPCCSCRRVFIRNRAPRTGFANSIAVSTLVMRALKSAGVESAHKGAHLFRHSLATDMIRKGASLDEIGQLLRHQSPNRYFEGKPVSHFFVSSCGTRLDGGHVRRTFYSLSRQIGLRDAFASHGPRLHDFRHRFAVEALLRWYRTGAEVERRLPILSTFLGHAHVTDTYWYLTSTPELLGAAGKRMEKRWGGLL